MTVVASEPTFTAELTNDYTIGVVTFGGHRSNAMSIQRMDELRSLLRNLGDDERLRVAVLRPGDGGAFGVGGDFHEVSRFEGGREVDPWIDAITELYIAVLELPFPVIAQIEGHAIGLGLQIALACDWRIGSSTCALRMPEFALGIACSFGGYMLERSVGRSVMQRMIFSCDEWSPERSREDGLLHEVVRPAELADATLVRAKSMAAQNPVAVQATRPALNAEYITGLRQVQRDAKQAHRRGFASGRAQQRMNAIIHKS